MLQACERATEAVVQGVYARHRLCQQMRASLYGMRRIAFEERECLPQRTPQPLAVVRRCTPRVRASTIAPAEPASMVTTPWQFGGAVIQRALRSADHAVEVPRVIQQMRRAARAAEERAASDLVVAQISADMLPTVGEVRHMRRLQMPPMQPAVVCHPPPLAPLLLLAARRKPEAPECVASMSGGGDVLYWERRQRALACVQAQHALGCAKRQADAADAFVSWYEADYNARVAAVARAAATGACRRACRC
jgi:hypothetical protein